MLLIGLGMQKFFVFLILLAAQAGAKEYSSNSDLCTRKEIAKLRQANSAAFWDKAEPILEACDRRTKPYGDSLLPLVLMGIQNLPSPKFGGQYHLSKLLLPAYKQGNSDAKKLLLKSIRGRAHFDDGEMALSVLGVFIDDQIESMKKTNVPVLQLEFPPSEKKPWNAELTVNSSLYPHWQNVQGLREAYANRISEVTREGDAPYPKQDSAFWVAIIEYMLAGPSQQNLDAVHAFRWSGGCVMSSSSFPAVKPWIDFSYFLALGDLQAALGAILEGQERSLHQSRGYFIGSKTEEVHSSASRLKRFLVAAKLPWRPFLLGLAAERKDEAMEFLAYVGGDSALPGVLLLDAIFVERRSSYIHALGASIPSQCRDKTDRDLNQPLSQSNQKLVLEKLIHLATQVENGDVANDFAKIMAELCHPALLQSAIEIATLAFSGPQEKMASYFAQYGVKNDFPKVSKHVAFILSHQGFPLRSKSTEWNLPADCKDDNYCGGRSSRAETDSLGQIFISRDNLRPGGKAVFCIADTLNPESPAFYQQEISLPSQIPEVLSVPILTGSLTVRFSGPLAFDRTGIKLHVNPVLSWPLKHDPSSYDKGKFFGFLWRKEVSGPRYFASFPIGRYELCAYSFGWSLACADSIEVKANQNTEVVLIPQDGSDVVFRLVDSATHIEKRFFGWSIVKNEKAHRSRYFSSQAFPPQQLGLNQGQYTLQIFRQHRSGLAYQSGFQKLLPFTVDSNSPSVIDLGNILIEAEKED